VGRGPSRMRMSPGFSAHLGLNDIPGGLYGLGSEETV
jgi:hypothetical protein